MFLVAVLLLFLSLLFIFYLHISTTLPPKRPHGIFSLPSAYTSFSSYLSLSNAELARMRASYASISHPHKKLGYSLGYPSKLNTLGEIYQKNAKITRAIAALAEVQFPDQVRPPPSPWLSWLSGTSKFTSTASLVRVRESLKHFVRDWSADGAAEREKIFSPVLSVLRYLSESPDYKSLLIPGSGLSRLAYESSVLGFNTTACELSMYMNLAFRFLLDESTTSQINQHEVHPYAHWFSHQRLSWQDEKGAFRGVKFPDIVPRLTDPERTGKGGSLALVEGDFLSLSKPRLSESGLPGGYDTLVTLFFIDTSSNIISTLSQIHHLLRPGGIWINLGPLLYTSSASYPGAGGSHLELSLDEVVRAAQHLGMDVFGYGEDGRKENGEESGNLPDCMRPRTIPCEYTADKSAMMRWIYEAEFFVARKVA